MNFDLTSAHGSPNSQSLPPEVQEPKLPDRSDVPDAVPREATALLSLGSLPCVEEESLNGEHIKIASCASACALLQVSLHLDEKERTIRFADEVAKPLATVLRPSPPRLGFDIVHCSPKEFETFLQENKEKGYLYKIWDCVCLFNEHAKSSNLTIDDYVQLIIRMRSLGTQEPYTTRADLGAPKFVSWPPFIEEKRNGVSNIRNEIAAMYSIATGNVLSQVADLYFEAKERGDDHLAGRIRAFVCDQRFFSFRELLVAAVVGGSIDLLEECFNDFEEQVRTTMERFLVNKKTAVLDFMVDRNEKAFSQVYKMSCDILILHKLETSTDSEQCKNLLTHFFEEEGNVLETHGEDLDLLRCYAASDRRKEEIAMMLFERGAQQIKQSLGTIDYHDKEALTMLADDIHRFADASKVPEKFKNLIKQYIEQVMSSCSTHQIELPQQARYFLHQAKISLGLKE